MQDIEFTVQEGKLFVLQCRDGKRTSWAAVKIAVDLVSEGIIDRETALSRLRGLDLDTIQRTVVVRTPDLKPVAKGMPAGHGVAVGRVAVDYEGAKRMSEAGDPVILVRRTIATNDVSAMAICSGVLTALGGRTSHAALLARHMDKVCVVGCGDLSVGYREEGGLDRVRRSSLRESISPSTGTRVMSTSATSQSRPRGRRKSRSPRAGRTEARAAGDSRMSRSASALRRRFSRANALSSKNRKDSIVNQRPRARRH